MKKIWFVALAEFQFWRRSFLVVSGVVLFFSLVLIAGVQNLLRMDELSHVREHAQKEAEQTFLDQPDRHPHRMVHYGHYVFRAPTPLSVFDPGLDAVTGQSIFLEGHRQNTAMFAESGASAHMGSLSWLTPAMLYQLFAPLLIVLLGHGAIARERESGVLVSLLAQGMSGCTLLAGKALALLTFALGLLLPLFAIALFALYQGESVAVIFWLAFTFFIYLAIWCLLTLWVATQIKSRSSVMVALAALWLVLTLVLPSLAVNITSRATPLAEKIETDLAMLTELRKLGDGHNANDPAFQAMRAELLVKYQVDKVEDLPINFRGLVAFNSEQQLTQVLNRFAETRMAAEMQQALQLGWWGWVSPGLALADASRSLSATDLAHYHRFLREAERLRFDFVQGLNRAHQDKLSYEADINRNKSEAHGQRARVDATNWQLLDSFRFTPATASHRIAGAIPYLAMLLAWFGLVALGLAASAGRLNP